LRDVAGRGIIRDGFPATISIDRQFPAWHPGEMDRRRHVTCNIQCSGGKCDRRMVDVRLETLPQDLPWSMIARRLVCKQCGTAGSVNIVPNWHDRNGAAVPFSKHWKT
jgi:hypothetical protein